MKFSKKHKKLIIKKLKTLNNLKSDGKLVHKKNKNNYYNKNKKSNKQRISSQSSTTASAASNFRSSLVFKATVSADKNRLLPILCQIESINNKSNNNYKNDDNDASKILFNDYLLIASRLEYKSLVQNLFAKANFENKQNFKIQNGKFFFLLTTANFRFIIWIGLLKKSPSRSLSLLF
jgi:hypothetical protein